MKVFVIVNNYDNHDSEEPTAWYFLTDSSVTNTGKPFYLLEDKGRMTVSLAYAIRISRLGKFISPEFSERYYSEFAPALHFQLPDFERSLREQKLPTDASKSFDRSLFIGDFRPITSQDRIELIKNGVKTAVFNPDMLKKKPKELLAEISMMNTMKMGDILLPGLIGNIDLQKGDFLEVEVNGEPGFKVRIK